MLQCTDSETIPRSKVRNHTGFLHRLRLKFAPLGQGEAKINEYKGFQKQGELTRHGRVCSSLPLGENRTWLTVQTSPILGS